MKIAIVCGVLDKSLGGGLLWTMQFIDWLADGGHEVHVITPGDDSLQTRPGLVVHSLPSGSRTRFASLAEKKVKSLSPDVSHDMGCGWFADIFHSHVGSPKAFYEALISVRPPWKRLGQLKVSRVLPRYLESDRLVRRQFSPSRDSKFVALSQKIVADFQTLHQIPHEKIRLIRNGVDVQRFRPGERPSDRVQLRKAMGIGESETVLVQVARNPELKGVPELIAAAARIGLDQMPPHIVVIGSKQNSRLRKLIVKMGMTERVHFVRATDQIVPYYQMADACVHATHYDACSLTVLEAMASGLPIITTRCNGAADMLTHGKEGWVLDRPGDPCLSAYIRRLLDPNCRRRMGRSARMTAEANSLHRNFENNLQLYREVADKKSFAVSGTRSQWVA